MRQDRDGRIDLSDLGRTGGPPKRCRHPRPLRIVIGSVSCVVLAAGLAAGTGATATRPIARPVPRPSARRAQRMLAHLPLYFTRNAGQLDSRVAFSVNGLGTSVYFTDREVTFALTRRGPASPPRQLEGQVPTLTRSPSQRWAVQVGFVGANPVRPRGMNRNAAVVSYFTGPRSRWHAGVPTYAGIVYRNLWPGIDLTYSGRTGRLEYRFLIRPGANPAEIRVRYSGATRIGRTHDGGLRVSTPVGGFTDLPPRSFQGSTSVSSSFARRGAATYGFDVGRYDRSRPLVIDPEVISYAGFIGGNDTDQGSGIAVDGAGAVYVTGSTGSDETSFPAVGGPDLSFNGNLDAFVAKVNPSGTALLYAGYIGGSSHDDGRAIAVDSSGNAYVTGDTSSTQATFPIMSGPDPTYNGGASDAFVAKVNPTGTALTYAGFIGGSGADAGNGIAVNASGDAFVTGDTSSDQSSFPVVGGPGLVYGGNDDAFVARVHVQTTFPFHPIITYAGYIGGAGQDAGESIAVDSSGSAYITGQTQSTQATFPVLGGPDLTANGDLDAFVAKVAASGTTLEYAGYIGGVAPDQGFGIAVDGSGNAFVMGTTYSDETSFPVKGGPELSFSGVRDAFVAEVNASGSALVFAGYLGGADDDVGTAIALDGAGDAFVAGSTSSTQATFPVSNGPDSTYNGGTSDGFVAEVAPSGGALLFAGYLGGAGGDYAQGIALHGGNTYVIGTTTSDQSTFPIRRGPDLTANGGLDAFVAEVHHVAYRPDGKIKRSNQTNYVGDDVYDSAGSGQTATAKVQRGATTTFDVQEQNDGTGTRDGFSIRGPGSKPGFDVRYLAGLRGNKDITSMVESGTYTLTGVAPGAARSFRIVIRVGPQAPELAIREWLVTATSAHDRTKRDAVLARVLVVPGSG